MNENKYLEQKNESMGEKSFMKKLLKKRLNQKGLTLIELLAVIVILAIVAAIAIPAIANLIQNQRDKAVLADGSSIIAAAKLADAAGACDLDEANADDTATTKPCNETNTDFAEYVGEVQGLGDADPTYYVGNDVAGANTGIGILYEAFGNIDDESTYFVGDDDTISEEALNKLMND